MEVTQEELQKALTESQLAVIEIVGENIAIRPEGFGFTYKEFAARPDYPYSEETARTTLNRMAREGKLERKKVMTKHGRTTIFFKPGTWPE